MLLKTHKHTGVIGVDVGSRCIKAAQLSGRRGSPAVHAAVILPRQIVGLQIDHAEIHRLIDVLHRHGFAGHRAITAVPGDQVFSEVLELPATGDGAPLETMARVELARNRRIAPHVFEMACWELPAARNPRTTLVFAAGCEHDRADGYMDLFEDNGMRVEKLTTASQSLLRACGPMIGANTGLSVIIDVGWHAARLILTYRNTIVFERRVEMGGVGRLHEQLCDRFRLEPPMADLVLRRLLSPPVSAADHWSPRVEKFGDTFVEHRDAIVDELETSLAYARHQYEDVSLDAVLLVGCGAMLPGLTDALERVTQAKTSIATPATICDCSAVDSQAAASPLLTAAVGLAMNGM